MKKTISALLVLMLLVSAVPGFALAVVPVFEGATANQAAITDSTGNSLSFQCVQEQDGSTKMYYYFNGQLETIYTLSSNGEPVVAAPVDNSPSYTLDVAEATASEDAVVSGTNSLNSPKIIYQPVGYILYKNSTQLGCAPICNISNYNSSASSTYTRNYYAGSVYADVVATVSSTLIGAGLATMASPTVAVSVVTAMIGYCGAKIINGLLSKAFTDTFYVKTAFTETSAKMTGSTINPYTWISNGFEKWATCHGYSGAQSEYTSSGITPRNWRNNASTFWSNTITNATFPGVQTIG